MSIQKLGLLESRDFQKMTSFSNNIFTDQKGPIQKVILQVQFREETLRKYIGHTSKH